MTSSSLSLSLDVSVQVDGSYSCLRGEDDRRLVFHPGSAGVKFGVFVSFKTGEAGLGDRCGGGGGGASSSSLGVLGGFLNFGGADAGGSGTSAFAASLRGVEGWLDFLSLGMAGKSIEGVDETFLCVTGRGGEPGGEISSSMD